MSFGRFVDRVLFAAGGYYATGRVQFGDGGHFETFPTALAPIFGRIVAGRARRLWERSGRPRRFEVFEVGAGDGQLALDTICHVMAAAGRTRAAAAFARALRYVISERSRVLVDRQRARLAGLPASVDVRWVPVDLLRNGGIRRQRGPVGLVVANEVLDCLPHERVVVPRRGPARATWVVPWRQHDGWRFTKEVVPLGLVPGLTSFLRRFRPEVLMPATSDGRGRARRPGIRPAAVPEMRRPGVYYACPSLAPFIGNLGRLYGTAEIWLVDYGGDSDLHLRGQERQKIWVGLPHGGRAPDWTAVFRNPGAEDVTFLVDFEAVGRVAEAAGLRVECLGPQGELARRAGVMLGTAARDEIVRHRVLGWALAVAGVPGISQQRAAAIGFGRGKETLRADATRSLAQFKGLLPTPFRVCILSRR